MESNKDEADRCLGFAEQYIANKNPKEAQKFIEKSQSLYPSQRAQDLLDLVKNLPANEFATIEAKHESNEIQRISKENIHRRSLSPFIDRTIRKIVNSKNYYDVLGVPKRATEKDIKRSFKKLALLLHPDKTQRPGATDAFRTIRNAAATLTDHQRRKFYDLYILDVNSDPAVHMNSQWDSSEVSSSSSDCNSDLKTSKKGSYSIFTYIYKLQNSIFRMLPLLFFTLVVIYFLYDPIYSLNKTSKHPVLRYTQNLKVPYYVKDNFLNENSGLTISQLDNEVEIETITSLQYACYNEKIYRKSVLQEARRRNDFKMLKSLVHLRLPSCESLFEMKRALIT